MTETPIFDQVVEECGFDPLADRDQAPPTEPVGGQPASGASPGLSGAGPQFPAEDVDAAPEAAAKGDSDAADSRDDQ